MSHPLSKKLVAFRAKHLWSQEMLAKALKMSLRGIRDLEHGLRTPRWSTQRKFEELKRVTAKNLAKREG